MTNAAATNPSSVVNDITVYAELIDKKKVVDVVMMVSANSRRIFPPHIVPKAEVIFGAVAPTEHKIQTLQTLSASWTPTKGTKLHCKSITFSNQSRSLKSGGRHWLRIITIVLRWLSM